MRVEVIEERNRFQSLRGEWNGLLEQSAGSCVFLTWEWLHTWWTHFAGRRRLCLLAVRDGDDLIGLAPLAVSPWRATHFRLFHVLEFLGTGSVGSDYLDIIGRRGREEEVAEALAGFLSRKGTMLELTQVAGDSSLAATVAARLAGREWTDALVRTDVCPFIPLAGHSWESYLTTLGHDHRYNVRRSQRLLASEFDFRFERATTDEQRRAALGEVVRLHQRRWEARGGSSTAFPTPAHLAFHEEFSRLALERGWLRLFVLRTNGTAAAAFYGFRHQRRFYFYQSGFDPAYNKYSVGVAMVALTIKDAIDEGADEYDFLHGDEQYKFRWTKDTRELRRLELYPPCLRGRLSRRAIETDRVARKLARRVLPPGVVQALVRDR